MRMIKLPFNTRERENAGKYPALCQCYQCWVVVQQSDNL
ncbi:hypothetical protein UYSO10_4545 [Kosakonia radicincitans]|nr:hypothetical protein UYSO10_4545 [Kosakonia radicincitans]